MAGWRRAVLLALVAGAPGAPASAEVATLLEQAAPPACAVTLRFEADDGVPNLTRLEVRPAPGGSVRLRGVAADWRLTALPNLELTLERVGDPAGKQRPALALELPASCSLTAQSSATALELYGPFAGTISAATVTGDLGYWAPEGDRAAVRLATSGEITVDFSISVVYHAHREPAKVGTLSTDSGPATESGPAQTAIQLSSRQGVVRVLRLRSRSLLSSD